MLGTGVTHSVIKVVARVVAREVKVPFARPLLLGRSTRSGCKVDAHDEIVRVIGFCWGLDVNTDSPVLVLALVVDVGSACC